MATLAEKTAELARAKEALAAARLSQSYGQGDRSLQRAALNDLVADVGRLSREVDVLTSLAAGARNPTVLTAAWRPNT